jgi:hypothetical protein
MTTTDAGLRKRRRYTITPQDGADDDGGTLYVLRDDKGEVLAGHAWPMPLERLAASRGARVEYLPGLMALTNERSDMDDDDGVRDDDGISDAEIDAAIAAGNGRVAREHDRRLRPARRVEASDEAAVCKVDGCEELWLTRKGIYGRLCARHKAEKMQAQTQATAAPVMVATGALPASDDGTTTAGLALSGIAAEVERVYDDLLAAQEVVAERREVLAVLLEQLTDSADEVQQLAGIGS